MKLRSQENIFKRKKKTLDEASQSDVTSDDSFLCKQWDSRAVALL